MAYENQGKCIRCGASIPQLLEGAGIEAQLCNSCLSVYDDFESEMAHAPENVTAACDMLNQLADGDFYARQKAAGAKILGNDTRRKEQ